MHRVTFHFDVVSPYAYLAFAQLPEALAGISHHVEYRPVLFAGLLKAWGHKGPAEIEPKREWTFRQIDWLARHHGVPLRVPAPHPFNPLALLRLALACNPAGRMPSRYIVEALMHHAWQAPDAESANPNDPARLDALTARLAPQRDPHGAEVKAELKALTDAAIARGLFGVPTFEAGGRLYWGLDALPMLREDLLGNTDGTPDES
jgi:2-hydroxychromene-2-carboxylate isomerase